ncbi:MAG: SpoIIE family protein phosphatase [Spirochaetes bacterium]|nr:SpoIIE family protein phosphatase [Spirochaetota bacterium]
MRIRYKILIAFIIIIAITMPFPLYILNRQIEQLHSKIINDGTLQAKQISNMVLNMLLLNSGNVAQTSIDANEYITAIKPLFNGLVSLKVVLFTPNPKFNTMLLADYPQGKILSPLSHDLLKKISNQQPVLYSSNNGNTYIEFIAHSKIPQSSISCATHLVFNESIILEPVYANYTVFIISVVSLLVIAYITSTVFSRKFSKPIELIMESLKKFDEGTTSITIPAIKQKDEIGKLAKTTQHLLDMVNLEIKELTRTNMELLRLNKLKDDFLSNISYEIKIPLESITHLTNSIIHTYSAKDSASITTSLEMISNSALRLSYMIDDILDFTRLKYNDIILNKKVVDISGVINFVISILQPAIRSKSLSVAISIDPQASHVMADEQRLQQILLNIIGNAVKYSHKGSISIRTQKNNPETLAIIVHDTAGGLPEQLLHDIDDFGYNSKSHDTPYGGLGLGLVITKKLMELHEGTISIHSVPNEGTTVMLCFPYNQELITNELSQTISYAEYTIQSASEDEHLLQKIQSTISRGFIYIVDDDPVNVKILFDMLTGAGYYVEFSHDAIPLFSILNQGKLPDLILLDTILPGTSAFQVCEKIRKTYSLYELPIMIITSKHRTQEIITSFRIGANDYLSKPFNKDELIARITNLITLKQSVQEHNEYIMLKHEIRLAHEIHSSVVVQDIPKIQHINIAHAYIPTREMGGDFYDVIKISDSRTGIMIADVTGHGIPAAIVCAMLKMALVNNKEYASHPAQLLTLLNKDLTNNIKENYITAAYALIDTDTKQITVSLAGHWEPLLIQKNGTIFNNWPKGFPIGWVDDSQYTESTTSYTEHDKLLLYTDGIIEVMNSKNKIFGTDRLIEYIHNNYLQDPQSFITNLIATLRVWSETAETDAFRDDVTIIMAELL